MRHVQISTYTTSFKSLKAQTSSCSYHGPPTFQKNDSVTLVYLCQPDQLAGSLCCYQNMWNSLPENVVGKINDRGSVLQYSHTQTDDISCFGFYPYINLSVSRCEPLIRIIGCHAQCPTFCIMPFGLFYYSKLQITIIIMMIKMKRK